jgi:DNA polymerase III sliding clamp (beta) subunit (PCNA family)
MKISMYAEDFKNITERAVIATAKKGSSSVMESVLIEASDNKVVAKAYNLDYYAEVATNEVDVVEEGTMVIHRDSLKSLYNMKGRITLESAEKSGVVKSTKKASRFFVYDKAEDFSLPTIGKTQHAFTVKQSELLAIMTKIKPYLFKRDSKLIYKGIHIVGAEGLGIFYGCSGFYGIRQKVHGDFDTFEITIPEVSKEIKGVSGTKNSKQDCDIVVSYGGKFVVYEGEDFKFVTRLLEGKYANLEQSFNANFTSAFDIDADEICKLAKEYKDISPEMVFTNVSGELSAMALGNNIQTMDSLQTVDNSTILESEKYIQSFNPVYVELVMKTYGKENVRIDVQAGMWKINGNSDCSVLLVPLRTEPEDEERVHSFVKNVA